jgi:superfamily II DNA or RNA helicase
VNQGHKKKKELYDYQKEDLENVFAKIVSSPTDHNIVYQLPTGGGKTVIFSEITRKYIEDFNKKVLILTHRIELSEQTSGMLTEFGVENMVINAKVKEMPDQNKYQAYVAMVETLNNRLKYDEWKLENIGLVIIDEAHYNSFRKLFQYFDDSMILGVTATPLSSNIKLPMNEVYKELIVGNNIATLIKKGFLAEATIYSFEVGLGTLTIGINGDYTVKSSEELYTSDKMVNKLIYAYNKIAKGKKTLIFNNGIATSRAVYHNFKEAGLPVRHLDSKMGKNERKEVLAWFKTTPDAILSSVGILTTGFDEPTIECIIMNRATRSLTLYFQMIGRGSRVLENKKTFSVIDLGNNALRFGQWSADIDWYKIFRSPQYFIDNLISDAEIEKRFVYRVPEEIKVQFPNSDNIEFDIKKAHQEVVAKRQKTSVILEMSLENHIEIITKNAESFEEAIGLINVLNEQIGDRIRRYSYCLVNTTRNYRDWVEEEYKKKLKSRLMKEY